MFQCIINYSIYSMFFDKTFYDCYLFYYFNSADTCIIFVSH